MTLVNIAVSSFDKPNRLKDKKDKEYHVKYGKFCISNVHSGNYSHFLNKTRINRNFYKGGDYQWLQEDVESFLKDDTNQSRNRIKVVNNVIRPMVEQYRGNANRMTINASVKALSGRALDRRDLALAEKMFYYDISFDYPDFSEILKNTFNIGETQQETKDIFFDHYQDEYAYSMNKLLDYIESLNKFQSMQMPVAEDIALTGMAVVEGREEAGNLIFEKVEVEEFAWDGSAKKDDLSDSEYMIRHYPMTPTQIYEQFQPSPEDADSIERYVRLNAGINPNSVNSFDNNEGSNYAAVSGLKVPVYKVYWRDCDYEEWGYVMTEFGLPKLVRINWKGYDNDLEPEYTDEDLIEPPKTPKNKRLFGNKKKRKAFNEVIRYCFIIPSDVLMTAEPYHSKRKIADVVLDFGVHDYQETSLTNPSKAKFPFKIATWGYVNGEVLSPVDDAISPQRFINRVLSAAEGIINMSGGEGPVFDLDTIDPQDAIDGTLERNVKQGKPVFVRTKGRGVPNSIGKYDSTPGAGAYQMMQLIPIMREVIQSSTGVNEPLQGQSSGSEQLVGVTEILVERGSLMQEPFYKAVENIFIQMYEMAATLGKRIYIENERNLVIATGDGGAEVIKLSKDMLNEEFSLFVKRDNSDEMLQNIANKQLLEFLNLQLIDKKIYANLYNRSKPDDVARALRQYAMAEAMAAKEASNMESEAMEEQAVMEDANLVMADDEQKRVEASNKQDKAMEMQNNREAEIEKAALSQLQSKGN